jgi:hypothetical protein
MEGWLFTLSNMPRKSRVRLSCDSWVSWKPLGSTASFSGMVKTALHPETPNWTPRFKLDQNSRWSFGWSEMWVTMHHFNHLIMMIFWLSQLRFHELRFMERKMSSFFIQSYCAIIPCWARIGPTTIIMWYILSYLFSKYFHDFFSKWLYQQSGSRFAESTFVGRTKSRYRDPKGHLQRLPAQLSDAIGRAMTHSACFSRLMPCQNAFGLSTFCVMLTLSSANVSYNWKLLQCIINKKI